jgi:carbon monoxide dehydrogenase subunit G
MKLEGDYLFEATVPEVWSALFDPVILAAVMPGCEKLDLVDGQYVGEIKVKVGPIQGKFVGKVDLKDKIEPRSYTMIVDGRGAPGFVKATAAVRIAPEGDGTRVFYDTDAQVGGKIASVGQRLLEASARAIVAQSLEGLHTNIKLRAAAHREAAAAPVATASTPTAAAATAAAATTGSAPAHTTESAMPAVLAQPAQPAGSAVHAPEVAAAVVAFTPVKIKQSALANAVAKEVASNLFPRSVLVGIILIQAAVIVWLLLRQ